MAAKNGNGMINFYENKEVQKLLPKYHNPGFDQTGIDIPCRILVCGGSGTGKTSWLLNFLARTNDTWGHIHIIYKASETLYEFLEKKLKGKNITFYTSLGKLPQPNELGKKDQQQLIVFDDQIAESDKAHQIVKEYMLRGRKVGAGVSCIYLSQSYFKIPKFCRLQATHLILFKLASARDMQMIMKECSLGADKEELQFIYKTSTREKFNFLKIDLSTPDEDKKFSHNWTDYFQLSGSDSD
jgi:hypothetical protein